MHRFQHAARTVRGFTLIELMITVAVVAILGAVALPSYSAYVQRSRVAPALDGLSSLAVRMEQCFQDTGTYVGCRPCTTTLPTPASFTVTCAITGTGSTATYLATATGSGNMTAFTYTIDSTGARSTTAHPRGRNTACWTTKGTVCDT